MADDPNIYADIEAQGSSPAPVPALPTPAPVASVDDPGTDLDGQLQGGLKGYGGAFVSAGSKYGIDPALLASIAMHETGRGTSRAFTQGNNAMGISPHDGGPAAFDSVEDSINQQARTLSRNPAYSKWRETGDIADLGSVYAPSDAPNDPRDLNKDWIGGVSKFYSQLKGKSPAVTTASPGGSTEQQGTPAPMDAAPNTSAPSSNIYADIESQASPAPAASTAPSSGNVFADIEGSQPAPATFDTPLAPDLAHSEDDNVYAQIESQAKPVATAPVVPPTANMPGLGGEIHSLAGSADEGIMNGIGSAISLGGYAMSVFDDNVDINDEANNPYLAAGQALKTKADSYVTDPAYGVAGKIANVGGGFLPMLVTAPVVPLAAAVGGAQIAGGIRDEALAKGASPDDAFVSSLGGLPLGAGATAVLGPLGAKVVGGGSAIASATWGQLSKNLLFGGLKASGKTVADMTAQNVGSAELVNTAVPASQQTPQGTLLWNSLSQALEAAPLGAITHTFEQATAEANVASLARSTGQDKATFITGMRDKMAAIQADPTATPMEKVAQAGSLLQPFSPQAQKVIMAHVENVQTAYSAIQQAAQDAQALSQTAPQTAAVALQGDVKAAVLNMQKGATDIEAKADEDEAALQADLAKSTAAETTPIVPVPEASPAEAKPVEAEPLPEEAPPPPAPTDVQTKTEDSPAESLPVVPPAEPAEGTMAAPPEPESVASAESAPDVAGEHGAEALASTTPKTSESDSEQVSSGKNSAIPPSEDLASLGKRGLLATADAEGVSEDAAKGAKTSELPDVIRANRLGQSPTALDQLEPQNGALIDPKIAALPAPHRAAVNMFLDAAKGWGYRGLKNFVLDTRGAPAVFTTPHDQDFSTVHINPVQLAHDVSVLKANGLSPEQIHQVYQKVFSEEFGHLQAGKILESDWKKAGTKGTFGDYYDSRMRDIYDAMTPAARLEAGKKYGGLLDGIDPTRESSEYDNPRTPAQLAEEYVRQVWQLRGSKADTEALLAPGRSAKAGTSAQTKALMKSVKSNQPLVRLIQSTVQRLKGIAVNLAGKGRPDAQIEQLVERMEGLTRDAEKPGKKTSDKPQRVNPLKITATAAATPENDDFDYFGDFDHENTPDLRASDGRTGTTEPPIADGQPEPDGSGARPGPGDALAAPGLDHPGGGQPGAVSPVPDLGDGKGTGGGSAGTSSANGAGGTRPADSEAGGAAPVAATPERGLLPSLQDRSTPPSNAPGPDLLRPNAGRRTEVIGHDWADAKEERIAQQAKELAHVEVPVEEQAHMQELVQRLGQFQFTGNAKARDVAESNAFVHVLLQSKRWIAQHGNLEAEDGHGNGFGARAIISRALLDEGRREGKRNQMFSGGDRAPLPEAEAKPTDETENDAEPETTATTPAYDPSENNPEDAQAAFEGFSDGSNVEGTSLDTPRRRAQDAHVDRNVAEMGNLLTPYGRRLLELWSDTPDDANSRFPSWANTAAKEFGKTKNEIIDDFNGIREQLKGAAQQRGLTRDDFTRMAGSPRPEGDSARQKRPHDYSPPDEFHDESRNPGVESEDARRGREGSPDAIADDLRGKVGADEQKLGDYRTRHEQAQAYLALAQDRGKVLPADFLADKRRIAVQGEHEVYDGGDRVYKITKPFGDYDNGTGIDQDYQRTPWQYLNRFKLGNANLGDDTRWEGVIPENGHLRTVTSQSFLEGDTPSQGEVEARLGDAGYRRVAQGRPGEPEGDVWHRSSDDTLIGDAKPKNWIKANDGTVRPIDVISEQATSAQRAKYQLPTHDEGPTAAESDLISPAGAPQPETFAQRVSTDDEVNQRIRDAVYGRKYTPIPNDFTAREAHPDITVAGDRLRRATGAPQPERFAERLAADENFPKAARDALYGREYTPIPNEFSAAEALRALDADGVKKTFDRVMDENQLRSGLTPRQRVVLGQQLMKRLANSSEHGLEVDVLDKLALAGGELSTYGKDMGQAVQALSMWDRLSPEGVLVKYARLIKPTIDAARKPIEPIIKTVKDALQGTRETAVNETIARPRIDSIINDAEKLSAKRKAQQNPNPNREPAAPRPRVPVDPHRAARAAMEPMIRKLSDPDLNRLAAAELGTKLAGASRQVREAAALDAMVRKVQQSKRPVAGAPSPEEDGLSDDERFAALTQSILEAGMKAFAEPGEEEAPEAPATPTPTFDGVMEAGESLSEKRIARENAKPVWQRYMEATSEALSTLPKGARTPKVKGALEQFADRLQTNLKSRLDESLTKGATPKVLPKLRSESTLGEIYRNDPQYQEAWNFARTWIEAKYADDPATLDMFGDALNRSFEAPVSVHDKAITDTLKGQGASLRDLVKQWAGKQNATRDELVKGIQDRLALDPEQSAKLGDVLHNRFKILLDQARSKELQRVLKTSGNSKVAGDARGIAGKIMEAVNLGATDDEATYNAIADRLKLPKYDQQVAGDLAKRAREIQQMIADGKEGFQTDKKTSEMLNALAVQADKTISMTGKLKDGELAVFYGNLFGPATIERKTISEVTNALAEITTMGIAQMRHGDVFAVPRSLAAGIQGLIGRGLPDATNIFASGSGLRRGEHNFAYESKLTERGAVFRDLPVLKYLNKPLSIAYKPVGRILEAGAAFFYAGTHEARANMLAYRMAKADRQAGKIPSETKISQRLAEIMGNTVELRAKFWAQAKEEGLTGRQAKLRTAELMDNSRPEDLRKQAQDFATRATFMQKPEGVLGLMSEGIQRFTAHYPTFKMLIPVHRIVSNVFNNFLSYTPVGINGAIRQARAGDSDGSAQQIVKVTLGALGTMGAYALFSPGLANSNNNLQLYGPGPTDYNKNKQLRDTGWIPYSIKIGDHYYSYREWPPSLMLATLGGYFDGQRYNGMSSQDGLTQLTHALLSTGRFSLSSSWISSVANLLSAFTSKSDNQTENSVKYAVASVAGSLVPFNQKTLVTLDKLFDPTKYDSKTFAGTLMSQVAFARRLNSPATNALGGQIEEHPFAAFNSVDNPDPIWRGLSNKGIFIPSFPAMGSNQEWLGDRTMTQDEHYRYAQESGQNLRTALENGGLDAMNDMDTEQAQTYLNGLAKTARDPVKAELRQEGIDNGTILSVEPKPKGGK